MSEVNIELKTVVFRACLVASWTDEALSTGERRFLSRLVDTLADNEQQRDVLNKLRLKDQNESQVLREIAILPDNAKQYLFDICLEALTSDRILSRQEQRFLKGLKKVCGISSRDYRKKLRLALSKSKTRMQLSARVIILILAAAWGTLGFILAMATFWEVEIKPTEENNGKEIPVSVFEQQDAEVIALPPNQVFETVKKSIVQVRVLVGDSLFAIGSGAVIGTDDTKTVYILTNKHVVNNDSPITGKRGEMIAFEVQLNSGGRYDATLDFYSREYDLAILAVKGISETAPPLMIVPKKALKVGQSVFAVGSPLDLKHSFTAGVVSALRENYIQTDATSHSGSSGGPLVDEGGNICGIITKSHPAKDFTFAIYSDAIIEMLAERKNYPWPADRRHSEDARK
jgi:S1-C subfamily serine protease